MCCYFPKTLSKEEVIDLITALKNHFAKNVRIQKINENNIALIIINKTKEPTTLIIFYKKSQKNITFKL